MPRLTSSIIEAVDAFGRWIAPNEARLLIATTIATTVTALIYLGEILNSYPVCPDGTTCPYLVPVFNGTGPTKVVWHDFLTELIIWYELHQIDMVNIVDAGLSGSLVDPMMASGFLVALIAIWLSLPLDRLFRDMSRQLQHDQILPTDFESDLSVEIRRRRWAWVTALIVATIIFAGTVGFFDWSFDNSDQVAFLIGSTALGALAGHRLGSSTAYGSFSRRFETRLASIPLLPGHADKMGGWRRVGEFIAYKAVLLLVPVMWLTTWLYIHLQHPHSYLLCPRYGALSWPEELTQGCSDDAHTMYLGWAIPQAALLVVALVTLYLAFLRPLYSVTRAYRKAREHLRTRYDSILLDPLRRAVESYQSATNIDTEQEAIGDIGKLTELREHVWAMPPVPLRTVATSVFSISAFYPIVTVALTVLLPEDTNLRIIIGRIIDVFKAVGI